MSARPIFPLGTPFFYGLLVIAIGLLVGAPPLWTAHSAGNADSDNFRVGPGIAASVASEQNSDKSKSRRFGNLDIRVNGAGRLAKLPRVESSAIARQAQTQGLTIQQGLSRLETTVPTVDAKLSPITGAVEVLRSAKSLTGPQRGRAGTDIVREFIEANSGVYGLAQDDIDNLNFIGESVSQVSGLRMVRLEQVVNGLPIFQSETRIVLDRDGRVIQSTGLMIPDAGKNAPSPRNLLSAQEALRSAMASLEISLDANQMSLTDINAEGRKAEVVVNNPQISGNVPSKLVYFPLAPGVLIPAWSQITFTDGDADWYTLVDATSGELLWRKNIRNYASTHQARFSVYVQGDGKTPADSPAPQSPTTAVTGGGTQFPEILRTTVSMLTVQNIAASPNGWIDDCPGGGCTTAQTTTTGNNVDAYMDRVGGVGETNVPDVGTLDNNGRPIGNSDGSARNRDFLGAAPHDFQTNFLPPPQGGNAESGQTATGASSPELDQYRRGVVTQLFYVCNWYHDQLFALGFDGAAGNFQQTNFSGMGVGNDRVLAEAQDSNGTNNANFSTAPDGTSGRAQMYRFDGPTIDRDGDLDSEVLVHELTHGTSNRLIGNAAGLSWDPGGSMGEGWSDFYALSLLNNTNTDDPHGKYAAGAYATYKFRFPIISPAFSDNYVYGIRRFPYSTDNSVNPLTWADVDDVTNDLSGGIPTSPINFNRSGALELHNAGEVWCLSLWEVRSRIIAANANDVPTGNNKMLSVVTDAMKMTPINPSFTEARDAIISADCAANACANEQSIWDGFADRGLGYNAIGSLKQEFGYTAGHIGINESFLSPYLDLQGVTVNDSLGNNNGSIDPGEAITIKVTLKNPWRVASKGVASASATLSTATAGVTIQDANSTYPAIPAQGNAQGDQFRFAVPSNAACGQSLKFTITPTSTLGSQAIDFVLRVGAPAGNGAPVTYTRDTNPDLAITDNTPRGVIDSLTIADDFEIADLNVRVDSLTHTFVGDLTFMVKAPNGYGTDIISAIGASTDFGSGDNLSNTLIDDQAVNDLLSATESQAPYTGSWITAFNGVAWDGVVPGATHDPVGRLSRLNGTSTQGTWRVLVADQSPGDTGTLNSWSLIVTPKAFTCTPVVPTAADSTISGEITEPSGSPLAGVVIKLSGTQSRKTITDANGNYRFDNVEMNGFYSVTPSLQSYHFSPEVRSFSQLGNTTNAVFTATRDAAISVRLIDTPEYFVRQHYLDFLGREPDESGFNFWSDQILSCGSDSGCRERRTINVSAAYFLSIEFQQTGGLVDGLYRASYGRMPRYAEFMPDTAVVARDVIVGRANWAQQLEANKQAFVAAWMERADFRAAYDGLSNAAYVDSLTCHTAGFNGDRSALANGLNSGALTRAAVLRQVVENEGFTRAKHNEMFVMMEYFGYLRRDPDASGYTFWLNKLNQFGGNFEQAEMVKAFIVSGEYRDRFR